MLSCRRLKPTPNPSRDIILPTQAPGPLSNPPIDKDADEDGLPDEGELLMGTDMHHPDTDRDGFSDGDEVSIGTNPLDPNSRPRLENLNLVK